MFKLLKIFWFRSTFNEIKLLKKILITYDLCQCERVTIHSHLLVKHNLGKNL